jgi:hypothetical protein
MKSKRAFLCKRNTLASLAVLSAIIVVGVVVVHELPKEQARATVNCSTAPISSATLIKTYHLLDLTDGFGVATTKDGGYLLTGDTIPAMGMAPPFPFVIKTDAKGNLVWSKWFGSQSSALGDMSSRRRGRLAVETTDGHIVTANDITDFVDETTKEMYGDILVSKINSKGGLLWSIMLGDYSLDRPQKLWALPDGGVMMLGRFFTTGHGNDVADSDTVARYGVLIKIDKNGRVVLSKKLAWDVEDMRRLPDGSFIALANIAVVSAQQPEHILGPEVTPHALPTMIKLDTNLQTVWAKSLEMIPSEINSISSISGNDFTMGKTKIRLAGGDFRAVQATPDGGFVAFGFENLLLTAGLNAGALGPITSFTPRSFIAVKVDEAGNYLWAKKLTTGLTSGISSNDFQVAKTTDNQFIIMEDVVHDSATAQTADFKLSQIGVLASNIGLIKTDADFNPVWVKKIEAERDLSGFSLMPTADKGIVIGASMLTTKQHLVFQTLEPYKEATLIKVDANGHVGACANAVDQSPASIIDQSQYLVTQDMSVGATGDLRLNINKKVKAKFSNIKDTARQICQYQKNNIAPICLSTGETAGPTATAPTAKTWTLINYENTKEVTVDGDKNKTVNAELLPMLNQLFANQVKVKDSMKSMWLTYVFARPVTLADVEALQKKYEALGYKIEESAEGRLYVSRVGLTLHMTFSIQNSMVGKLEVLF